MAISETFGRKSYDSQTPPPPLPPPTTVKHPLPPSLPQDALQKE